MPQVCDAISEEYRYELFVTTLIPDGWKDVAQGFGRRWNFPHACGAIDRKHINIKNSGSAYFNYKCFFSIVLMGLVDADNRFQWVHVDAEGAAFDAGIFNRSSLEPDLRGGRLFSLPLSPSQTTTTTCHTFLSAMTRSHCEHTF